MPGIGPARAEAYARAGLTTRRELLYHLPSRYRIRPDPVPVAALEDGRRGAIVGTVLRGSVRRRGRRSTVSLKLRDDVGDEAVVLLFNRAYLAKGLVKQRIWAAGRAEVPEDGVPRLLAADYERLAEDADGPRARCLPLYRLPEGVAPRTHRKVLAAILDASPPDDWRDTAPGEPALAEALAAIHLADDLEAARVARRRLAWDEAWALSLEVGARRAALTASRSPAVVVDDALHARILARLPHVPTRAQARAIADLREDLAEDRRPMGRLLQGDVGSGKTLVAFYALLAAVACGRQGAIMAPTEVLAAQHARELQALVARGWGGGASGSASSRDGRASSRRGSDPFDVPPRVAFVSGSGTAAEKRAAREAVADGSGSLVVGTHALQGKTLEFADLALTVVDEQHRFGVRQRVRFRGKGEETHLLVMTATPIPRTLALTAYGELDVSLLDELPPGRSPRDTRYVTPAKQPAMWKGLAREVAAGAQGYVVCPSITSTDEESHSVEATLEVVREHLRQHLGDVVEWRPGDGPGGRAPGDGALDRAPRDRAVGGAPASPTRVAAVHGRLPADERDAVLDAFRAGEVSVLVATVLVEVGLDVPAATFVVLPDPSRFGLATLHQIRGRVGRGERAGRCLLLGPLAAQGKARERVDALCDTEDGFLLAEEDLKLRGPGEMLGTRQSGMPGFLVLDPVQDVELLAEVRPLAIEAARDLTRDQLAALRDRAFPATKLVEENLLAGG